MALEYGSGITGGCNCHLKVKLRGQLGVKQQNVLYRTYGCLFQDFCVLESIRILVRCYNCK